ncbi:CPBP family intramembrane glutamic endopeptidase [Staphylococcus sp. 11261D007BR]
MDKVYSNKVSWRDLWAFPLYIIGEPIVGRLMHLLFPINPLTINLSSILTAILLIAFLMWSHRRDVAECITYHIRDLKKYIGWIIVAYILYIIANGLAFSAMQWLPEKWQFTETSNQDSLKILFENPTILPIVFINIAILSPICEELLFRQILIGELGKKFGRVTMGIISIVFFASMHLSLAQSPFEAVPYLLMGIMFVVLYLRSGCNVAVSITSHILMNTIAFISIVAQLYF